MSKFTIEEKHRLIINALNNYKNIDLNLEESCLMCGITVYQFQRWLEDKRLERLKQRYLAVVEIRSRNRAEAKVKMAERIINENIEGYELLQQQVIHKVSPEGKMIPLMVKKMKKEIGPNINAAIRLLHLYDKPVVKRVENNKEKSPVEPRKLPEVIIQPPLPAPPAPEPEVVSLPPILEIIEVPEDYGRPKEKEEKEKDKDKEEEVTQPIEQVRYIKLDEDTIIEI
jgi:hypothetical protein